MKPTFNQTVNVLVQAYLNDTLEHRNCYACAVGNLVANGLAITMTKEKLSWPGMPYPALDGNDINGWGAAFASDTYGCFARVTQKVNKKALQHPTVLKQVQATGYKWEELAKIELAFESADCPTDEDGDIDHDAWMFNGLMAVVDVLADIHSVDLTVREDAKLLFAKP